jgi:hypothetical protein
VTIASSAFPLLAAALPDGSLPMSGAPQLFLEEGSSVVEGSIGASGIEPFLELFAQQALASHAEQTPLSARGAGLPRQRTDESAATAAAFDGSVAYVVAWALQQSPANPVRTAQISQNVAESQNAVEAARQLDRTLSDFGLTFPPEGPSLSVEVSNEPAPHPGRPQPTSRTVNGESSSPQFLAFELALRPVSPPADPHPSAAIPAARWLPATTLPQGQVQEIQPSGSGFSGSAKSDEQLPIRIPGSEAPSSSPSAATNITPAESPVDSQPCPGPERAPHHPDALVLFPGDVISEDLPQLPEERFVADRNLAREANEQPVDTFAGSAENPRGTVERSVADPTFDSAGKENRRAPQARQHTAEPVPETPRLTSAPASHGGDTGQAPAGGGGAGNQPAGAVSPASESPAGQTGQASSPELFHGSLEATPRPVRDLKFRLEGSQGQPVELRFVARGSEVQVTARVRDEATGQPLSESLTELVERLREVGFQASESGEPASGHTPLAIDGIEERDVSRDGVLLPGGVSNQSNPTGTHPGDSRESAHRQLLRWEEQLESGLGEAPGQEERSHQGK